MATGYYFPIGKTSDDPENYLRINFEPIDNWMWSGDIHVNDVVWRMMELGMKIILSELLEQVVLLSCALESEVIEYLNDKSKISERKSWNWNLGI